MLIGVITFSLMVRIAMWNQYIIPVQPDSLDFWRSWYMKIYYPTHTRLDGLGMGVLIGYLMQYSSGFKKIVHHRGNMIFLLGLVLLGISFWICNEQTSETASVFGFTLVALSYGFIVVSAVSKSSFLYRSKSYITAKLAALSYAIYLSHKGIIHMVQVTLDKFNIQTADNICLILCLLACIAAAVLYTILIEKPFSGIRSGILKDKEKSTLQAD